MTVAPSQMTPSLPFLLLGHKNIRKISVKIYVFIKSEPTVFLETVCNDIYVLRENNTFIAKGPHYIAPPVLQLQPCVFHGLVFWDVAHMQHTTVETLFIHVSLGGSKQEKLRQK